MSKHKPTSSRRPSSPPQAHATPVVAPSLVSTVVAAVAPVAKAVVAAVTPAAKPAAAPAERPVPAPRFTDEERRRMIARLAFSIAERASFQSDPFNDWVTAEREVDRQLSAKN